MNETSLFECRNVTIKYDTAQIVSDVSFSVALGEVVAILGPNGSGKSTLIKALLGLTPIASGTVQFLGEEVSSNLLQLGYLPQRFDFDKTLPITVDEFLRLFLHTSTDESAIDSWLAELGVMDLRHSQLGELSGGQLQRVNIARALLNSPQLLILDEPEAGIDASAERNLYETIVHLKKHHQMGIILVSHEVDMVHDFADRVVCLNKSQVCYGVPSKVLTKDMLELLYDGGLHKHQHDH
ncbi:metal ABC transporter ATP-binding protein [Candidatus Falkowbacteria bacterium]|nr:metal ABC transporter ATP-binding protein [Candidatus Falkowbacteria bacterium]